MPTTRPRLTVTETDELAAALDHAAQRWPQDAASRPRLLLRLARAGHDAIDSERAERRRERVTAVVQTAGALTGVYPDSYLDRLRDKWPR